MVYIYDFSEFAQRIEALYIRDPTRIRCSTKMRGQNDQIVFKVTNDKDAVSMPL
jgi:hypothetical protein